MRSSQKWFIRHLKSSHLSSLSISHFVSVSVSIFVASRGILWHLKSLPFPSLDLPWYSTASLSGNPGSNLAIDRTTRPPAFHRRDPTSMDMMDHWTLWKGVKGLKNDSKSLKKFVIRSSFKIVPILMKLKSFIDFYEVIELIRVTY